jgi:1-deoxy-D-xylulose-5-phosphate synthase
MYTAQQDNMGPFSIRYPRGNGVMADWRKPLKAIPVGTGRKIADGEEVAILTIGHVGNYAVIAREELEKEGLCPAHYDMRFVKPLDKKLLHEVFSRYKKIVTVEDGCIIGGFGSAIAEFAVDNGYLLSMKRLGIPDEFIEHGEQLELHTECGYHPEGIMEAVRQLVNNMVLA